MANSGPSISFSMPTPRASARPATAASSFASLQTSTAVVLPGGRRVGASDADVTLTVRELAPLDRDRFLQAQPELLARPAEGQ